MSDIVPVRIYAKLFSASYASKKRLKISNFTNLVDFLAWETLRKGEAIQVNSLDSFLLSNLKDLMEKIGFMLLSVDVLNKNFANHQKLMKLPFENRLKTVKELDRVDKFSNSKYDKYYLYNFIIYTKASLDSIAVTLNSFFRFNFKGGNIDFRKHTFVNKIETSLNTFNNFSQSFQSWIDQIVEYRDAVIHQKSIEIYPEAGTWRRMIPLHPLSDVELSELRETYDAQMKIKKKGQIAKNLILIDLNLFMKTSTNNILKLTGFLSSEILNHLKLKYPNHKPSKTYYR